MKVVEKTEGIKIDYSVVEETVVVFGNELFLNLEKYERDEPVHIDVSRNAFEMLVTGTSRTYVAQIDIPARQYEEIETEESLEENMGSVKRVPKAFDMNAVTLTLWGGNENV